MHHPSSWDLLSAAVMYVMTTCGIPQDESQSFVCEAIRRGDVEIQCRLRRHKRGFTSTSVLAGTDFDMPKHLEPKDVDWEESRPLKQWYVRDGRLQGWWDLESIEISRASLAAVVRAAVEQGDALQHAPPEKPASSSASKSDAAPRDAAGPAGRRGPRPTKFERVKDTMRNEIQQDALTLEQLEGMREKNFETTYGVSRDTARRARNAVLSELRATNSRQTPTTDK